MLTLNPLGLITAKTFHQKNLFLKQWLKANDAHQYLKLKGLVKNAIR